MNSKRTLLEILMEELPKRGGWPNGCNYIYQDYDKELRFSGCLSTRSGFYTKELCKGFRVFGVLSSSNCEKVTKDQYDAAITGVNEMEKYESFLDALVSELPKFGSWPNGTRAARIDSNGEIIFIGRLNPRSGIFMKQSSDWDSFVVSEAEYRAALAEKMKTPPLHADSCVSVGKSFSINSQDDGGWIEWNGGECPVSAGAVIDYKIRCGRVFKEKIAGKIEGEDWGHFCDEADIVSYRLSPSYRTGVNQPNETPVGITPGTDGMLLSSTIDSSADNQMRIAKIIADELPELAASKLLRLAEVLNNQIEGNKK